MEQLIDKNVNLETILKVPGNIFEQAANPKSTINGLITTKVGEVEPEVAKVAALRFFGIDPTGDLPTKSYYKKIIRSLALKAHPDKLRNLNLDSETTAMLGNTWGQLQDIWNAARGAFDIAKAAN